MEPYGNATALQDYLIAKVTLAHFGNFEGDTINITMSMMFCCGMWGHSFEANKQ